MRAKSAHNEPLAADASPSCSHVDLHPRCPRCGYDLSGATAAWAESCPLRGVCSECGLSFEWANLLREDRQELPWLYEHARRWWSVGKALRTLWMLVLPWRFWGSVRVHHRVVPRRLAAWPMLSALVLSAVSAALCAPIMCLPMASARFEHMGNSDLNMTLGLMLDSFRWVIPVHSILLAWSPSGESSGLLRFGAATLSFTLTASIILLVCPSEWRRARIRGRHLLRVAAYGLGVFPMALIVAAGNGVALALTVVFVRVGPPRGATSGTAISRAIIDFIFDSRAMWDYFTELAQRGELWFGGALLAWQAVYWWFALRRGLELRRVWALWLMCIVAGALGALALPLVGGGILMRLF